MLTVIVPPGVISGGVASAQMARYLRHHPLTPQEGLALLVMMVVIVAVVLWICKHWY